MQHIFLSQTIPLKLTSRRVELKILREVLSQTNISNPSEVFLIYDCINLVGVRFLLVAATTHKMRGRL